MSNFGGVVSSNGVMDADNSKFTIQYDSNQQKYTIAYNGKVSGESAVVASPTLQTPGLSYMLYSYTGGFTMQVFQTIDGVYTPVASSFNFIVKEV
ncbi:MAG: hypothetical protein AB8B65_06020 [Kordia sp.]|uniref:hypothetical protein n=1 Tax=Kordia sp. TaxID=1965332 RepID=UPI00385E18DF